MSGWSSLSAAKPGVLAPFHNIRARSRHVLNKAAAGKVGRGEAVQCGELQEALTVSRENIAGTETHHRYRTLHKEPKLKETYLDAAKFY